MNIDPTTSTPLFQQIVDGICAAVAASIYRPGDLIPSVRQQALKLLVNPNTVQRAYEYLEREGLLISRRGSGMEVAPGASAAAAQRLTETIRTTFESAIATGKSAKLSRTAIDGLYKKAWNNAGDNP
jgi:GntR family transcriptional regulator